MISLQTGSFNPTITAIVAIASVAFLAVVYPDRFIGTRSRKVIHTVQPAYPVIGNLNWILAVVFGRIRFLHEVYHIQTTQAKGGQPLSLTFPALGGRVTCLNNPAYVEYIQKTNFENYIKGKEQRRMMGDTLGHGIFVADGDLWLKQRKLAANIFSKNNFETYVQTTIHTHIKKLDTLLQDAVQRKVNVNFPDLMFRFTLDSFGSMAFGADIDSLPTRVDGLKVANVFAKAFDAAQEHMNHRIFALLPNWCEIFTQEGRDHRRNIKTLNTYCDRIINLRLEKRAKEGNEVTSTDKTGKDLLELFMDRGLDSKALREVVLNMLIAGRDTTAQTLAWMMLELWKKPGYIGKIRESIVPVLGSPDEQRPMNYEDMRELPFLQAAFYETSRLNPAVPANIKKVVKDDIIRPSTSNEKSNINLPDVPVFAGESVMWSDWTMGKMPEVWGEDALEFKPERFLEDANGQQRCKEFSPFKFHSFNGGNRICLGKSLATYEGMSVAAAILGRYDIEFDDQAMQSVTYGDSLTLPCSPYDVRFKLREEAR